MMPETSDTKGCTVSDFAKPGLLLHNQMVSMGSHNGQLLLIMDTVILSLSKHHHSIAEGFLSEHCERLAWIWPVGYGLGHLLEEWLMIKVLLAYFCLLLSPNVPYCLTADEPGSTTNHGQHKY